MDQGNIIQYLERVGEHPEVNRIELVSFDPLAGEPWLICVADGCRRRTIIHASPSRGSWKPKRRMSSPTLY
jgi:hypothetical protein